MNSTFNNRRKTANLTFLLTIVLTGLYVKQLTPEIVSSKFPELINQVNSITVVAIITSTLSIFVGTLITILVIYILLKVFSEQIRLGIIYNNYLMSQFLNVVLLAIVNCIYLFISINIFSNIYLTTIIETILVTIQCMLFFYLTKKSIHISIFKFKIIIVIIAIFQIILNMWNMSSQR